jgi:hypothetical protein
MSLSFGTVFWSCYVCVQSFRSGYNNASMVLPQYVPPNEYQSVDNGHQAPLVHHPVAAAQPVRRN